MAGVCRPVCFVARALLRKRSRLLDKSTEVEEKPKGEVSEDIPERTGDSPKPAASENTRASATLLDLYNASSSIFSEINKGLKSADLSLQGFAKAQLGKDFIDFLSFNDKTFPANAEKSDKSEKQTEKSDSSSERSTAKELLDTAKEVYKDKDSLSSFESYLNKFEERSKKDGISIEEKERFYSQVKDVLEAGKNGNKLFDADYLKEIGKYMVKEAAFPGTVNQGPYPTCTAAALQSALFKVEPATVGGLVRDLALRGEYKTQDGSIIQPNEKNLKGDKYHETEKTKYERNPVDQLAQIGLLNIFWQRRGGLDGQDKSLVGKIKYEEGHARDFISDGRTRLMDYSQNPPEPLRQAHDFIDPGYKRNGASFPSSELRPIEGPRILDMANVHEMYSQLRNNHGNLKVISASGSDPVFVPKSKEDLENFIEKAKAENNGVLPAAVLGVFTDVEPFKSDLNEAFKSKEASAESNAEEVHAHHAVALFEHDSKSKTSTVENQWGDSVDHTGADGSKTNVQLADLYQAIKGKAAAENNQDKSPESEKSEDALANANRYIAAYEKLVKELEQDSDANPKRLFEHQRQLQSYYRSWDRQEDNSKQLDKTLATFQTLQKSDPASLSLQESLKAYEELYPKEGKLSKTQEQKFQEIGKQMQEDLQLQIAKLPLLTNTDKDWQTKNTTLENAARAIQAFESSGNSSGAGAIVEQLKGIAEKNQLSDKKESELTNEIISTLAASGKNMEARSILAGSVAKAESLKQDKPAYVAAILNLAESAEKANDKNTATSLWNTLDATFAQMKAEQVPINDEQRSILRHELTQRYERERNAGKLEPLIDEYLQARMSENPQAASNKRNFYPFTKAADSYSRIGNYEKAVSSYEKALELSKLHGEEGDSAIIADKMIPALVKAERLAEAEKLAKEYDLDFTLNVSKSRARRRVP